MTAQSWTINFAMAWERSRTMIDNFDYICTHNFSDMEELFAPGFMFKDDIKDIDSVLVKIAARSITCFFTFQTQRLYWVLYSSNLFCDSWLYPSIVIFHGSRWRSGGGTLSAGTLHWQFCAPTIKTVLLPHYYIIMNLYRYFIEGSCWYGDSCFYAHDMNCRFFLAGNCRNGSSCRFIHGNNNAPTPPPFGTKSEQREVTRTFSNSQDDQKSPLSRVDAAKAILREKSQGVARVPCVQAGVGRKESLNKRTCSVPFSTIKKHWLAG